MTDTDQTPAEFMLSLRHPGPAEVDEMRRIGRQPGACGLDAEGRLVVVENDGRRQVRAHKAPQSG
ncbi:hypothetical protein [Pelagibacterium mangrovi]|uniref:hypothetical protein n=1 Tax=Pelagibacterium mangrovi TaxID=3119828 RepID=UPI002FCB11BF